MSCTVCTHFHHPTADVRSCFKCCDIDQLGCLEYRKQCGRPWNEATSWDDNLGFNLCSLCPIRKPKTTSLSEHISFVDCRQMRLHFPTMVAGHGLLTRSSIFSKGGVAHRTIETAWDWELTLETAAYSFTQLGWDTEKQFHRQIPEYQDGWLHIWDHVGYPTPSRK